MSVPMLNHRLTLEAPVRVSDGAGGFSETWSSVGVLWAELVSRSGSESVQSGAPISKAGYKITVRTAPVGDAARPVAQQRFRDGERIFAIQAVVDRDTRSRYLTCFANEEVVT